MSSGNLPEVNALIELAVFGGQTYRSRVEDRDGGRITVAAPLNLLISDVPEIGRMVTVRWPAGVRGRFAAPAKISHVRRDTLATWEVELTGAPVIEQNRRFVRGGGGEDLRLRRALSPEDPEVEAWVVDISERSLRARVQRMEIKAGDPILVRVTLDDDTIEMEGSVLRVAPQPDQHGFDVVVVYDSPEAQATVIRRYVLRQQMLARAREAD